MEKYIERDLVNFLFFDLNTIGFFVNNEIFEYDVQSSIHKYLMFRKVKGETIEREKEGRTDIVIKRDNGGTNEIHLLEVKSYIKNNEKISTSQIIKDIEKIVNNLNKYKAPSIAKGYFILVFKEGALDYKYKKKETQDFVNFLKKEKIKKYVFYINKQKITTRIIRSFKTAYFTMGNNYKTHKNQIRIIMFEIKK